MIITKTPFRISLFGGGTDYPEWYKEHGGAVLSTAIDKYCYITCRKMPDFFAHSYRIMYAKVENCRMVEEIQHPVVRETLKYLNYQEGLEIHHDADLPARSGVGSSSAFTVGLLKAVSTLSNFNIPNDRLVQAAIHIERDLVGDIVGDQDQVAVTFGGFNYIMFDGKGYDVHPACLLNAETAGLEKHLMLFHTNKYRIASYVAKTINFDTELLKEIQKLPAVALDLIKAQDWKELGSMLHCSWNLKKRMSESISTVETDSIYQAAMLAGAWGGKVIGAGAGGFMLFMVPEDRQAEVKEKLKGLVHVPFKFETNGSGVIFNNE